MDRYQSTTHPFIVKIWLEESTEEAGGKATWRGYITHIPSKRRRYFSSLDDITGFIAPYLEDMGVKVSMRWRIRQRLKRR
jgi:hypothetical protein